MLGFLKIMEEVLGPGPGDGGIAPSRDHQLELNHVRPQPGLQGSCVSPHLTPFKVFQLRVNVTTFA